MVVDASAIRPLIVFDLDGTLIDSRLDLAESVNEMLAGYGAAPLAVDAVVAMVGDGARMLVARALCAAAPTEDVGAALDRFRAIYDRRLLVHTRPYEGIVEVVRATTARASIAVLTNKPEAPTRRLLDAFDLARDLMGVVGGDSGFPRKPDPGGLRHLVAVAGATAGTTLLVGDSQVDAETAVAAGAAFCAARYGFGRIEPAPRSADTPAEVGRLIAAFVRGVESAPPRGAT